MSIRVLGLPRNLGLIYFYFTPSRIFYNFKKASFKDGVKNALAFIKRILGIGGK